MKKIFIIVSMVVFFVQSCTKVADNVYDKSPQNDLTVSCENYERALQIAELAPQLFVEEGTKSAVKSISSSSVVLSSLITKSSGQDTLMYLFNYSGDTGYVVVPADADKGRILAYSDNGSFDIADTASNSLTRFLMERMIAYCESEETADYEDAETKAVYHNLKYHNFYGAFFDKTGPSCNRVGPPFTYDFDDRGGINRTPGYYENYGCTTALNVIFSLDTDEGNGPLLPTCWGQLYPYNLKAPLINGENAAAGCVATALSQIMAYYSYPTVYPARSWLNGVDMGGQRTYIESLRKTQYGNANPSPGFRDNVSTLYRIVGDKLMNEWGIGSTSASSSMVSSCLYVLGYTGYSSLVSYNSIVIIQSLNNGWPVYIDGQQSNGTTAHAWVIDGYRKMRWGYQLFYFNENGRFDDYGLNIYDKDIMPETLLHCNFGWNGNSNGYYHSGIFSSNSFSAPTKFDYSHNIRMIHSIKP